MRLITRMAMRWQDKRLSWDPLEYDGVDFITVKPDEIWTPDIMLQNWAEDWMPLNQIEVLYILHFSRIYIVLKPELKGRCVPDYNRWPFDEHTCHFTLKPEYLGNELNLKLDQKNNSSLVDLLPHPEWELLNATAIRKENTYGKWTEVSIILTFTVRRYSTILVIICVLPAFAYIILTCSVFWLHSTSAGIIVLFLTLSTQCLFLQFIGYKINSNGRIIPKIVKFYSYSIILSTIVFSLIVLMRSMMKWTAKPVWLQPLTNLLLTNRVTQVILLNDFDPKSVASILESGEDEGLSLVSSPAEGQQWHMFSEIINKITFFSIIVVYIYLFNHFIL
uniref:Neurotransmitter-gated ion-channel ligand-binding domain-containing protein n=2 Tax=Clastoptera arizonana TaxID=38151 RepID=A0A1B6CDJ5_9HEMI